MQARDLSHPSQMWPKSLSRWEKKVDYMQVSRMREGRGGWVVGGEWAPLFITMKIIFFCQEFDPKETTNIKYVSGSVEVCKTKTEVCWWNWLIQFMAEIGELCKLIELGVLDMRPIYGNSSWKTSRPPVPPSYSSGGKKPLRAKSHGAGPVCC